MRDGCGHPDRRLYHLDGRLPEKADPATVPGPVIDTLVIAYISTIVLLGLGTIWRIRKFPITRADHEERVRRLAEGEKTVEARAG